MIDQNKQLVVLISSSLKPPKKKKTEQKSGNNTSKGGVFCADARTPARCFLFRPDSDDPSGRVPAPLTR